MWLFNVRIFNSDDGGYPRKLTGVIIDIQGYWEDHLSVRKMVKASNGVYIHSEESFRKG